MEKQGWYNIYNAGEKSVITIITQWVTFYFDISLSRFDKSFSFIQCSDFVLRYLFLIKNETNIMLRRLQKFILLNLQAVNDISARRNIIYSPQH